MNFLDRVKNMLKPPQQPREEVDPHCDWISWRVVQSYGATSKWELQSNRQNTKTAFWSAYPHLGDVRPTPERCIVWLSLYSNPYKEDPNG